MAKIVKKSVMKKPTVNSSKPKQANVCTDKCLCETHVCKVAAILAIILGILFLLQDLLIYDFWDISWYTVGFILTGLTFLFAKKENLYFGTNLLTDHIQASVLDLTGVTGDDVTRVIMQFSGGTQVVDLDSIAVGRRSA